MLGDAKAFRDLRVAQAGGREVEDLPLALRQLGGLEVPPAARGTTD